MSATNSNIPRLIAFSGPPCSGKSTLVELLSHRLSMTHLAADAIRSALFPGARNRSEQRRVAYRAMHLTASYLLKSGTSVILDATYHPLGERTALEDVARGTGALLYVVECRVPTDLASDRARRRRATEVETDLSPEQVQQYVEHYHYSDATFRVYTDARPSTNLNIILEQYLSGSAMALGRWSRPSSGLTYPHFAVYGQAGVDQEATPAAVTSRGSHRRTTDDSNDGNSRRSGIILESYRPSDREVYERYREHCSESDGGFLIAGIPVYFLIPPEHGGAFTVQVDQQGDPLDQTEIEDQFARAGLDFRLLSDQRWRSFLQRATAHDERLLRHCALHWVAQDRVEIVGAPCTFRDYFNTEAAVNLRDPNGDIDLRAVLEGDRWLARKLQLHDMIYTRRHFSAAVSVAALIETSDGYLVLQRRSDHVLHGAGNLACTASGFVSWERDVTQTDDETAVAHVASTAPALLRSAVLREIEEEVGLKEEHLVPNAHEFIGAAYNLLHGRDLNFYAAVKSRLKRSDLGEMARHAPDRWEHSELLFVPIDALDSDGTITGTLKSLNEQCNRHLRAALYAIAQVEL